MSTSEKISVFIVDDVPAIRRGLTALLRSDAIFEVVGSAADGPTAVAVAAYLRPQIILLDYWLPEQTGIEIAHQLFQKSPAAKVIFLSHYAEMLARVPLKNNVFGLWLKGNQPLHLLEVIKQVARGRRVIHSDIDLINSD